MSHEPTPGDRRTFARALLGFYLSCTVFGIAATVAAAALIVFPSASGSGAVATISIVITVSSGIASWWTLKLARGG